MLRKSGFIFDPVELEPPLLRPHRVELALDLPPNTDIDDLVRQMLVGWTTHCVTSKTQNYVAVGKKTGSRWIRIYHKREVKESPVVRVELVLQRKYLSKDGQYGPVLTLADLRNRPVIGSSLSKGMLHYRFVEPKPSLQETSKLKEEYEYARLFGVPRAKQLLADKIKSKCFSKAEIEKRRDKFPDLFVPTPLNAQLLAAAADFQAYLDSPQPFDLDAFQRATS